MNEKKGKVVAEKKNGEENNKNQKKHSGGAKHRRKWLIIGILAVVVIAVIVLAGRKATPVRTAPVEKGEIRAYVEERARTTLPRIHHLTMPLNGRILPITIREGETVTKGEIVARMDTDNLETTLAQYRAAVEAFDKAVEASRTRVPAGKAMEEYARWLTDARKNLYPARLISEMLIKSSEKDLVEAESESLEFELIYHSLNAFNSAIKLLPVYVSRDLDRAVLKSPIDGIVLKKYVTDEMVLPAGKPLLDIGDLDRLEVTADILSESAGDIKPGDPVEIYGPALGPDSIRGTVSRIKPEGFTKLSSLGVEEQRVPVVITFNQTDLKKLLSSGRHLGLGYRVRVRIYTASRKDTLTVPRTAIFQGSNGGWKAYAVEEGKADLVAVSVGILNDKKAEITAGLAAGDRIIVAPGTSLTAGTRVKPSDAS